MRLEVTYEEMSLNSSKSLELLVQKWIHTAFISLGCSGLGIIGVSGGKSACKWEVKSYVISFNATYPPEPLLPLWKIPAPAIGMGRLVSTGWMSRKGIVFCAASLTRSLGAKFKYWFAFESGNAGREIRVGILGFVISNLLLKPKNNG